MIDVERETLLTLEQAAQWVPVRNGKHIHPQTIWCWMRIGVAGVVLESVKIGHGRLTSKEALRRFFARLTKATAVAGGVVPVTAEESGGMDPQASARTSADVLRAAGF